MAAAEAAFDFEEAAFFLGGSGSLAIILYYYYFLELLVVFWFAIIFWLALLLFVAAAVALAGAGDFDLGLGLAFSSFTLTVLYIPEYLVLWGIPVGLIYFFTSFFLNFLVESLLEISILSAKSWVLTPYAPLIINTSFALKANFSFLLPFIN